MRRRRLAVSVLHSGTFHLRHRWLVRQRERHGGGDSEPVYLIGIAPTDQPWPELEEAAKQLYGEMVTARVNCDQDPAWAKSFVPRGYWHRAGVEAEGNVSDADPHANARDPQCVDHVRLVATVGTRHALAAFYPDDRDPFQAEDIMGWARSFLVSPDSALEPSEHY